MKSNSKFIRNSQWSRVCMYSCEHVCLHTHMHTQTHAHRHRHTALPLIQKAKRIYIIGRFYPMLLSDREPTLQVALTVNLAREPLIYSVLQQTFVKCTLCTGKVRRLLYWITFFCCSIKLKKEMFWVTYRHEVPTSVCWFIQWNVLEVHSPPTREPFIVNRRQRMRLQTQAHHSTASTGWT